MKRLLPLLALVILAACATALPEPPDEDLLVADDAIVVSAIGKTDPALTNDTQRHAVSREAAMLKAQLKLRAYAERIRVGRSTVGQLAASDPVWAERLRKTLADVQTASTDWTADGSAKVTLKISRQAIEQLRTP
jgi:hypothetical protein